MEYCNKSIVDWNQTEADFPSDKTIPQLFEEQVRLVPENVAVTFQGSSLTYEELNRRSNEVAHFLLREQKVKVGEFVALFLEKSELSVIAILAILKAGAVYVPIDPSYPIVRVSYILKDSSIKCVLSSRNIIEKIEEVCAKAGFKKVSTVDLNRIFSLPTEKTTNPKMPIKSRDLAYVIYTSGSTGQPKGSLNEHRSFINRSCFLIRHYEFTQNDVFIQRTAYVFDVSGWELLTPLLCGARIIIPDKEAESDLNSLVNLMNEHGVSRIHFTPSLLGAFINYLEATGQSCPRLKSIYSSGEELPLYLVKKIKQVLSGVSLHNIYGPSEADITYYDITDIRDLKVVPIGKPISNVKVYVLDDAKLPVPIDVEGELYIGGIGLARAYLNQPQLTAECFINNQFQKESGNASNERLYKTGDRVKWTPDGNLIFLGRSDLQIKVNGYRVELAEIEATLHQVSGMKHVAVVPVKINPDSLEKQLVAYYVADHDICDKALRSILSQQLPKYMVPNFFVPLTHLPINVNGKLDRNALPLPSSTQDALYMPAMSRLEVELTALFSTLLAVDESKLSMLDSFFDLGGNSITAISLLSHINYKYNIRLKISDLFENATIRKLSLLVQIERDNKDSSENILASDEITAPLSLMQNHLWWVDQLEINKSLYNIVTGCILEGALCLLALQKALQEITNRHACFRTIIATQGNQAFQSVQPLTSDLNFSYRSLMEFQSAESALQEQLNVSQRHQFDLQRGPLYCFELFNLGSNRYIFIFTVHHIIADAWSLKIFYRELSMLYNAFLAGVESPLLPLTHQYGDFARYQQRVIKPRVQDQVNYWCNKLKGIPEELALPFDKPRTSIPSGCSSFIKRSLGLSLLSNIKRICQQNHFTLYMFLLATYLILLARYTQQNRIVVGTPIVNRKLKEVEDIAGFFVNMVAVDVEVDFSMTAIDVLQQVRRAVLLGFDNQDAPFEEIVNGLKVQRDLSKNPLFQATFVFDNLGTIDLKCDGMLSSKIVVGRGLTKFDLLLHATEDDSEVDLIFEYSKDLFDHDSIERLATNFLVLLTSISETPYCKISELEWISSGEKRRVLQLSKSKKPISIDSCLHELFEKKVEEVSNKIALYFKGESITFGELNAKANGMAKFLLSKGVQKGDFIVFSMNKSIEFVIAYLATLKVGGIYVPVHPAYPVSQIAKILNCLTPKAILCDRFSCHLFLDFKQAIIIDKDLISEIVEVEYNLIFSIQTTDTIYVLFTSGSTGVPKAVLGSHATILARFVWMWERYPYFTDERMVLLTPINTIDITFEILGPLLKGFSLVIIDERELLDTEFLVTTLADFGVTRLDCVPSYLKTLLDDHIYIAERLPVLRLWGVNGEFLSAGLIKQFFDQLSDRILISRYGATEATTTFFHEYHDGCLVDAGPASGADLFILDKIDQMLPIGVLGEVFVYGATMSSGYLGQSELTRERFVQLRDGRTYYKTGDIAKLCSDGSLIFLGRKDFQVKIRGFSVDVSQVEAQIQVLSFVKVAVVMADYTDFGETKLNAYVSLRNNFTEASKIIRETLRDKLPAYMVPSSISIIEEIPLMPNGKMDRMRLLKTPSLNKSQFTAQNLSSTELQIKKIWEDILNIEVNDCNANFFELGGHSLLASRLLARIRDELTVHIQMRDIFSEPSIKAIAARVDLLKFIVEDVEETVFSMPIPKSGD